MSKYLFGIKPTGNFHLGHLHCLKAYKLNKQDKLIILIADLHAYTTKNKSEVEYFSSNIAASIKFFFPEAEIILQSSLDKIYETFFYLLPLVNTSQLKNMHGVKDKSASTLMFSYPVLMCLDLFYISADCVLIGSDQKQHLEFYNKIFHQLNLEMIDHTKPLVCTNLLEGIDGKKMSKSYDNHIAFLEEEKNIVKKILSIKTFTEITIDNIITKNLLLFEPISSIEKRYSAGTSFFEEKQILIQYILKFKALILETIKINNIWSDNIEYNCRLKYLYNEFQTNKKK